MWKQVAGGAELVGGDQEGQAAGGGDQACGGGEDLVEAFDSAKSDHIE